MILSVWPLGVVLLLTLAISLGINAYLWVKVAIGKHAAKSASENAVILQFLRKQIIRSNTMRESAFLRYANLNRSACSLRIAYLKIEESALEKHREARDYYIDINKNLAKLLQVLQARQGKSDDDNATSETNPSPSDTPVELYSDIFAHINRLADQIAGHRLAAEDAKQQTQNLLQKITQIPDVNQRITLKKLLAFSRFAYQASNHVNQLEQNSQAAVALGEGIQTELKQNTSAPEHSNEKIAIFMTENDKLRRQIEFLRQQLQAFKHSSEQDTAGDEDGRPLESLMDVSERVIEANEKEIKKLRVTVRNQKSAIAELEEMLENARKNTPADGQKSSDHAFIQSEVAKLHQCLRESETCIEMLEKELQTLKSRVNLDVTQENTTQFDALQKALHEAQSELTQQREIQRFTLAQLKFVRDALEASSVEDLALLIFECLTDLECAPNLIIYSKAKHLEMSPAGNITAKDKTLIEALRPEEISCDEREKIVLVRHTNLGGLLRVKRAAEPGAYLDALLGVAKLADYLLAKISRLQAQKNQRIVLDLHANALKQSAHELDKLCEGYSNGIKQTMVDGFNQLQQSARTKNVNVAFIARIKTFEQEITEEIGNNNTLRLKIRKEFLGLLKRLEDSV